ncbi:hypothetical protein [Kutzneria chonburiensis]|uniref:Uncharacterized protein n=1 Tax=Kutzneria chonburiensis TaxID=1483604 RepID=A0ABV6N791_9PSEU|nr:hypothetical protein [Kutzneria chonburiensis]
MLRSFIDWLDDYLAGEGPSGLARAVVGLLSFAALCGAILGDIAIRAGAIVAIMLLVLGGGLVLLADRRSLQRRIRADQRLIFDYAHALHGRTPGYHITSWDKTIVVAANGDAVDTMKVRARAERTGVQAFYLWFGCGWPQPAKYQRKVHVEVRTLLVDDVPGTRLDRTVVWFPNGRFVVIVQFPSTLEAGNDIYLQLEVAWPGKCRPLIRGECDRYTLTLSHLLTQARYKIVLPKGADTYSDPIGFQEGVTLKSGTDVEGRPTHVIEAHDVPPNHAIGLQLELKKGAYPATRQGRPFQTADQ